MSSVGMVRYFLPVLTAPFYYATPENEFGFLAQHLPSWMVVTDQKAIIGAYEGIGRNSPVPWSAWITSPNAVETPIYCYLLDNAVSRCHFS